MDITREKLIAVLGTVKPNVDFDAVGDLVAAKVFDSLGMVTLAVAIEDNFGVRLTPMDIVPANFRTVDSILAMIARRSGARGKGR